MTSRREPLSRTGRFGRRDMLRGLGAAAASLPFLRSHLARAGVGAAPKIVFFASPNSFLVGPNGVAGHEGWLQGSFGSGAGTVEAAMPAALRGILEPLTPHRADLLAIHGLRGHRTTSAHQQAASMLTGTGVFNDEPGRASGGDGEWYSNGISIDQLVAQRFGCDVLGMSFDISAFQLGEGYISHFAANRGFTPIQNPVEAFERVYGDGSDDSTRAARYARQQSVLDAVSGDLAALTRRLPAADRPTLDAHLTAARDLERDLAPGMLCSGAAAPGSYDHRDEANLPRLMGDYTRTLVGALACGVTRVGFVQVCNLGGGMKPRWPELGIVSNFTDHAITHKFGGESGAGSDGLSQADAIPLGISLQTYYNQLYANLIEQLATTLDVDGNPLLDTTIVMHVKQMGENHDRNVLFWMLAGGRSLGIRTGRTLRLDTRSPYTYTNDLHVSLLHAMGITDIDSFGDREQNRTPLDLF